MQNLDLSASKASIQHAISVALANRSQDFTENETSLKAFVTQLRHVGLLRPPVVPEIWSDVRCSMSFLRWLVLEQGFKVRGGTFFSACVR